MFLQKPAYVRGLFTEQSAYVCGMTPDMVHKPLYLFKKKRNIQSYRVGRTGMAPDGDQNPLKDSEDSTETRNVEKLIRHPKIP